jgi:hypothetical protein
MFKRTILISSAAASAIMFVGCGGSSSSSGATSGVVVGSYYRNAKVCLDANNNGKCDAGETVTTSSSTGAYTLAGSGTAVVAEIGTDAVKYEPSTGVATAVTAPLVFRAPADAPTVISSITTMVVSKMDAGLSITDAKSAISAEMGLTVAQLMGDFNKESDSTVKAAIQAKSTQAMNTIASAVAGGGDIKAALKKAHDDFASYYALPASTGGSSSSSSSSGGGSSPILYSAFNVNSSMINGTSMVMLGGAPLAILYNAGTSVSMGTNGNATFYANGTSTMKTHVGGFDISGSDNLEMRKMQPLLTAWTSSGGIPWSVQNGVVLLGNSSTAYGNTTLTFANPVALSRPYIVGGKTRWDWTTINGTSIGLTPDYTGSGIQAQAADFYVAASNFLFGPEFASQFNTNHNFNVTHFNSTGVTNYKFINNTSANVTWYTNPDGTLVKWDYSADPEKLALWFTGEPVSGYKYTTNSSALSSSSATLSACYAAYQIYYDGVVAAGDLGSLANCTAIANPNWGITSNGTSFQNLSFEQNPMTTTGFIATAYGWLLNLFDSSATYIRQAFATVIG